MLVNNTMTTNQHYWIDRLCEHGFRVLDIGPNENSLAYTKKGRVWWMYVGDSVSDIYVRRLHLWEWAFRNGHVNYAE